MFQYKPDDSIRTKRQFHDSKKRHFDSSAVYKPLDYPHRLNFYTTPPTEEVTLDQFEQWAIDRLKVLGEIESALFRNRTPSELRALLTDLLRLHLPLDSNSSRNDSLNSQRRKDHYSHFILRLAFARSDELRRRFIKAETVLFKHRFDTDDGGERAEFIASLGLDWEVVGEEERERLAGELRDAAGWVGKGGRGEVREEREYCKVEWEKVAELVEQRKVYVKGGKAYVPASLQASLVVEEFKARLEKAMELTARALPRLDEDERLIPILNHLSIGFNAPEYDPSSSSTVLPGESITAASIDSLASHFPACMVHLHQTLRRNKHLKHFGRLQYTLFLKGIGLSIEEALLFWRTAFTAGTITEDKFNKEYRYNIRHAYGLEGNRKNYKPFSCQQILLEHAPGTGEAHGCPYRHFGEDNLNAFLQSQMGVRDMGVLKGVRDDRKANKFHLGCNRVFEYKHKEEIKKARVEGKKVDEQTIIHPNEYFLRSWELTHLDEVKEVGRRMEGMEVKDEAMM